MGVMSFCLECLNVGQEIVPGGRRLGDARIGELLLVVPEAHHAEVEGDAVLLAVDLVHAQGARVDLRSPRRHRVGDVLDETGVGLLAKAAATPRLEQVRRRLGLHQRRELGLESLVLQVVDVDRHFGVIGHVLVSKGLPEALARIVVLDVVPVDRRGRRGGRLSAGLRGGLGAGRRWLTWRGRHRGGLAGQRARSARSTARTRAQQKCADSEHARCRSAGQHR